MTLHEKIVRKMKIVAIILLFVKNSVALDDTYYDTYDDYPSFKNETMYQSFENETDYLNGLNQVTVDLSDHVFAVYEEDNEKWSVRKHRKVQ